MNECPVIHDLLPLYVDDALSPESRALVEAHLPGCADCRRMLKGLQGGTPSLAAPLPDGAAPSEEARFLTRLKRQVGTILAVVLVLLIGAPFGVNWYGNWRADQAYGEKAKARQEAEQAALAAIKQASPDPLARLKERGVSLTYQATRQGDELRVDYVMASTAPAERATLFTSGYAPPPRLLDPATGQEIGRDHGGGGQYRPDGPTMAHTTFGRVPATLTQANVEMPYILVSLKSDRELAFEVERTAEEQAVLVGQRFTVAGVEFEIERIRFTKDDARIDYRQITPVAQVGLHLLSIRLSDRMGGDWGESHWLRELPDPLRPSQRFEFVPSLSKHWLITVEYAVLALPGPTVPVEVK